MNRLTNKQIIQLAHWIERNRAKAERESFENLAILATEELRFEVNWTNMRQAIQDADIERVERRKKDEAAIVIEKIKNDIAIIARVIDNMGSSILTSPQDRAAIGEMCGRFPKAAQPDLLEGTK